MPEARQTLIRSGLLLLPLLLVACSGPDGAGTTSTAEAPTTTTTIPATTSTEPPVECPPPPYELEFLPTGVGSAVIDAGIEPDVWTSVPGSGASLLGRADGTVAIALIRGTLPPIDWPAEKGEVFIDGTRAAVGPHPDGTWVAGWFEAPGERCDLYTMVFYPPIAPTEVEQVIDGMNRVGG
ncbi:MAG TPA: hypothetical protein VK990_09580 [Acidimicrobiia bacterium]|nr:hypothetical protein [Acidimicrobiia bacterium]